MWEKLVNQIKNIAWVWFLGKLTRATHGYISSNNTILS